MAVIFDFILGKLRQSDTGAGTGYVTKTLSFTLGTPTSTGVDQKFTSAANKTKQSIRLSGADIIPAGALITMLTVTATQDWNGSAGDEADNQVEAGTTNGGSELMTVIGLVDTGVFANTPLNTVSATALSVYISATPTTNNWSQFTAGKLAVYITYIDYASV